MLFLLTGLFAQTGGERSRLSRISILCSYQRPPLRSENRLIIIILYGYLHWDYHLFQKIFHSLFLISRIIFWSSIFKKFTRIPLNNNMYNYKYKQDYILEVEWPALPRRVARGFIIGHDQSILSYSMNDTISMNNMGCAWIKRPSRRC